MARMPASTPTVKVSGPDWLPQEWVQIKTYGGSGTQAAIADALTQIAYDPATGGVVSARYTLENSALERRRQAVVGWQLFEETEPGVAGKPIPFSRENIDNLDPLYAQWLNTRILEEWSKWQVVTGTKPSTNPDPARAKAEDATTAALFQKNLEIPTQSSPADDSGQAAAGDGAAR